MRYGAFLSYSHADDRHARWLLQRLEGYRVPKRLIGTPGRHGRVPARLGPVFRDRDELPTAGDLGSTITAALSAQDPSNNQWRVNRAQSRHWQATFAAARAAEPGSERPILGHARALVLEARLALERGDLASARGHVEAALAFLAPAMQDAPTEALRQRLAQALLVQGDVLARGGDATAAAGRWTEARQLLEADAAAGLPFGRLDPLVRVLQHLGLGDAALPHLERLEQADYVPMQPFPLHRPGRDVSQD